MFPQFGSSPLLVMISGAIVGKAGAFYIPLTVGPGKKGDCPSLHQPACRKNMRMTDIQQLDLQNILGWTSTTSKVSLCPGKMSLKPSLFTFSHFHISMIHHLAFKPRWTAPLFKRPWVWKASAERTLWSSAASTLEVMAA